MCAIFSAVLDVENVSIIRRDPQGQSMPLVIVAVRYAVCDFLLIFRCKCVPIRFRFHTIITGLR